MLQSFAAAERLLEELRNKAEAASPPEAAASPQVYSPDSAGGDREGNEQPESTSAAANSGDRRMPVEVCVDYVRANSTETVVMGVATAAQLPIVIAQLGSLLFLFSRSFVEEQLEIADQHDSLLSCANGGDAACR